MVDFIDMEDSAHRTAVLAALESGCAADPAKSRVAGMSELGLVELSRKRTRESLARQFCEPCEHCSGTGLVARPAAVAFDILRALLAQKSCTTQAPNGEVLVIASEGVVARLLSEDAEHLSAVTRKICTGVRLQAEPDYAPDAFELVHL